MYPVSAAYKTAIGQNVRDVRITGTITLKDNSVINITDEDIVQGSLYITEQCVAGEDIEVGNVYASEMGLSLSMPLENPYSLDGARILINFGINVETDPDEPPIWEYVPLGYFYVTEIQRKANNVNLTALDGMLLFDIPVGDPGSSSPRNFVVHACEQAGVTLGTSVFEIDTFANAGVLLAAPDTSKIKTCRDLLMWACQIMGAFARMNRQGELEIVPIKARPSVKTISKAERFNSDVSDFAVKITKVSMQVGETVYSRGTDGMTMVLEENPLMTGLSESQINAVLDNLLAQITTAVYVPFNSNFIGDPALQPGDFVTLSDTSVLGGGDVASIITHSTWRYRGPHNLKAAGKHGLVRGVQNQQMKAVSSIMAIARAAQDLALSADQSAQLIKDAIGGHVLIRQAPDETNEILIMDHPDPEQATKIWRWNMGGLGYSDNCVGADNPDREYEIAMTMDGAINANFIKTGQIDAGVVRIGPETTFAPGYDPSQIEGASAVGMGVDADCVGLWHFDGSLNSHKGVAADSDGAFDAGCFGQALNIVTDKYLKVPTTGMEASTGTINFRAKNLSASANGSMLIDLPDNAGNQGMLCGIADDGKLFIEDAKLQFQSVETSQADFQTGTLVDVVATSAGNLELAKDGTDVTYTETSQADFQTGTLVDVVATSAGDLQLATGKKLGTREKVVDISSVGANNTGSIINFTKTDAVVTNVTFTRSSVAYLSNGTQVPAGQPRFEPGKFGQGVLIEEGTTNLLTNPSFENGTIGWAIYNYGTFTQDATQKLFGSYSCKFEASANQPWAGIKQTVTVTAGTTYTLSAYFKAESGGKFVVEVYAGQDFASQLIAPTPGVWQRVSLTFTVPSGATSAEIRVLPNYGLTTPCIVYIDGIQLEQKPYATSFIDGTRSPERLTIPTAGILNPQEGTVECWVYLDGDILATSPAANHYIFAHSSNPATLANAIALARKPGSDGTNLWRFFTSDATGQESQVNVQWVATIGWHYFAARWSTTELALFIDGTKVGSINNPKLPGALASNIYIATWANGLYWLDSLIDDLRISSRARTDEEIATAYASGEPLPVDKWTTYKMNFDNNLQATVGTVDVEVALSVDGGDNYSQYSEVKSGLPIPGLAPDTDLTNGRLKIKETLYTSDDSVTPQLHSLDFTIYAYATYKSSGYRYKEYDISNVGKVGSSRIAWESNVPANTTLTVKAAVSTDGGLTYGGWATCTNGSPIPVLTQGMDISNARLKVQEDLATSDGTKTPQLQSLTIDVDGDIQKAYGPNKSTLTAWDSISLAWKPERLSLVVNDSEACYIENPGLPASLGSHVFIGTDRNGANAINTLVDELRIDKVYREVNIRTGWHKTGVPFYTSEDMKQWPGYMKLETDGLKVYDAADDLRVLVGSWMNGLLREYGIKIIRGLIEASTISGGSIDIIREVGEAGRVHIENGKISMFAESDNEGEFLCLALEPFKSWGGTIRFYYFDENTHQTKASARIVGGDGELAIVGDVVILGDFEVTGRKDCVEQTENYGTVVLSARESPEIRYIDEGVETLVNGECRIDVDPIFMECIEPNTEYSRWHIHLTPYADVDIYVAEIGENYFVVKEKKNGTSTGADFTWSLSAIRKNYAGIRLMEVTN